MSDEFTDDPVEKIRRQRRDPKWREFADKTAQQISEAAANDKATVDDKLAEAEQMVPEKGGVPVTMESGGKRLPMVTEATANDLESFAIKSNRTCGQCRFFNLEDGRREIYRQGVAQRLVLEMEWKLKHLGAPLDHCALCDASGGTLMVTTVSDASTCDQFRPRSKLFRR